VKVYPSHFLSLPSWPTTLQAFALVANPRLGLRHLAIPKIRNIHCEGGKEAEEMAKNVKRGKHGLSSS